MIFDLYDAFEVPDDKEHFGDVVLYVRKAAAEAFTP
jgi:hypothetical protein